MSTIRAGQTRSPIADANDDVIRRLASSFDGVVIGHDDPRYESARRVWNGSIERRPAAIARCSSVADVIRALREARAAELPVAVRGGGHSFPGLSTCEGGLVIDLGPLKRIRVDGGSNTVRAQAGVLLGELDRATQAHRHAVPVGAISHTGLAGLTLGGGIGWLMRKHGLTIDRLRSAQVITVDGEVVTASAAENAELFWGLRGGGGNFGIVVDFEFELRRVGPSLLCGLVLWPLEDGEAVMTGYREWSADAPDELTTAIVLRRAPATDLVPRELHRRPVIGLLACWCGDADEGERVLQSPTRWAPPLLDTVAERPFVEFQSMLDASYPHGLWAYLRSADVRALSDDVIGASLEHGGRIVSPRSSVTVWQLGGAVARVGAGETAFGSRGSGHIFNITGATDGAEGFEHERTWAREYWEALAPHQTGTYVNFLMDEGEDRVRQAYGRERYERLRELKRVYDPQNVLRLNQNIRP